MAKLTLENPEPPISELEVAIKRINQVLRVRRGKSGMSMAFYASAKAAMERSLFEAQRALHEMKLGRKHEQTQTQPQNQKGDSPCSPSKTSIS